MKELGIYFLIVIAMVVLFSISPVLFTIVLIGTFVVGIQYFEKKRKQKKLQLEQKELWLKEYNEKHGTNYTRQTMIDENGEEKDYYFG